MDPRDEDAPVTIDAQYVSGFSWTRNPQLRFVDKIADGFWAGLSLESPQATGIVTTTNLAPCGIKGTLPTAPMTPRRPPADQTVRKVIALAGLWGRGWRAGARSGAPVSSGHRAPFGGGGTWSAKREICPSSECSPAGAPES